MTTEIPDNHEIRQVWADNETLRTIDGTIEMARAGDRGAIETLMGSFVMKVENGRNPAPEIMSWIAESFLRILEREPADVAFGLRPGPGGKRPPLDSKGREHRARIAAYILQYCSPDERGSITKAIGAAVQKFNISEGKARQIFDAYKLD